MRLMTSGASPFSRKVKVFAAEVGLSDTIKTIETDYDDPESGLWEENPLGRVPTLIMGNGNALNGSSVICAFLDTMHNGPKLIPEAPKEHWRALHGEALADGLCEAGIAIQRELARPIEIRSDSWIKRQKEKIYRTTTWFDKEWDLTENSIRIDLIALACTLSWFDHRLGDQLNNWRESSARLSDWLSCFSMRNSMIRTRSLSNTF
ncbi:MAG: glutathione S-transferase N-terminal domain-containing protein [Rhodospirillaceae bacterium]